METEAQSRWVPIVAGLATVAILTIGALAGILGLLFAWFGSAAACGFVFRTASDPRADRATVAMIVLVPAVLLAESLLVAPLWAVGGPWVAAAAGLALTALMPALALRMAAGPRRVDPDLVPAGQAMLARGWAWPSAPPPSCSPVTWWASWPASTAGSTRGSSPSSCSTWCRSSSTCSAPTGRQP